jgi:hypothetical protein
MRDPVDRLWSQLRHLQQVNPEARIAERWEEAIQSPRLCARSDYEGTVSDLDMNFDEQDLLYLFYEDLFAEPSLHRLCEFIETPYRAGDAETRQNRTEVELELSDDTRAALTKMLKRQYDFCRHRFGDQVPDSWQA